MTNNSAVVPVLALGFLVGCSNGASPEADTGSAVVDPDGRAALHVSLRMDRSEYVSERPLAHLTVKNVSPNPQRILAWATPLGGDDANFLNVSVDGRPVRYVGRLYRRLPPTEADYIELLPGESREADFDVSALYDLSQAGRYSLQLKELYVGPAMRLRGDVTLAIFVQREKRTAIEETIQRPLGTPAAGGTTFAGCSAAQQSVLLQSRTNALLLAKIGHDNLARATLADAQSSGWRSRWFGTYDTDRYNTVVSRFAAIRSSLDSRSIDFLCDCNVAGAFAFVRISEPFKIHLCPAFWSSPPLGFSSRAGTVLHEMSHFLQVAATDDIANTIPDSEALARNNPALAIRNADSYTFYAEGSLGKGVRIHSDRDPDGAFQMAISIPAHAAVVQRMNCSSGESRCRWLFRDGMIVNEANPNLAINAWGGAVHGGEIRVHEGCTPSNPDCQWIYLRGMFLSANNPFLAMNRWNGDNVMRLHSGCTSDNPDCTFTARGMMFTIDAHAEAAVNAWNGAQTGGELRVHTGCAAGNPDCTWTYRKGMIVSERNAGLAIASPPGAVQGTPLRLNSLCTDNNANCRWTFHGGRFISDQNTSLAIGSTTAVATGTPLVLTGPDSGILPVAAERKN
jgi:peptidyl-Lys metalloendopeptidase